MTIEAIITLKDGTVLSRIFDSFEAVGEWYDRRHEHVESITARTITVGQMRQGRVR